MENLTVKCYGVATNSGSTINAEINTKEYIAAEQMGALIAAAPELLAGAKELEYYASRLPFESVPVGLIEGLVRIRAAIAKAEGR